MEQRIDRSSIPPDILQAIDTIYEYLPSSLLTEIRITKQDGSFCTPTSGTSPSPPPDDVRARRSVERNIARFAAKRAAKKLKIIRKSPEEIRQALRIALQVKVKPEALQKLTTYEELYINASNANKNESTYAWHILGKKLRNDEDPKKPVRSREISVSTLFREKFPHVTEKNIANDLYTARRIFDVTRTLSQNQIMSIKSITVEDIRRITKRDISKVIKLVNK